MMQAMAPTPEEWYRQGFDEALELSRLPDQTDASGGVVKRYMSHQPAWKPGGELPWHTVGPDPGPRKNRVRHSGPGAFGGVVYALSPLAAARAVEEEENKAGSPEGMGRLGIHSIQGVFTNPGLSDRPFVLDVSTAASNRSFSTHTITARQPLKPAADPSGRYELSDAEQPLGEVCLTCITTFKRPFVGPTELQETSAQERFASLLSSRAPTEWEPSPQADVDIIKDTFPNSGPGAFPVLDMYKVDMSEFNADKPVPERLQLTLYRPLKHISKDDVSAHVVSHAFGADRNGLILLGNHIGYGYSLGAVASLSFAFFVHVNVEEAIMNDDDWWVQEMQWPRVSSGRALVTTKIWSPEGKLVATGFQDGIISPLKRGGDEKL